MAANHNDLVRGQYASRATTYETTDGGWHATLASHFCEWVDPQHGETVLDLACGTGLVAIPLAAGVGATGTVVAVDLTSEMIEVGKAKFNDLQNAGGLGDAPTIQWIVADIASEELLKAPAIRDVLARHGGFDIISLCSALVLLPDQAGSVKFWVKNLLKRGGRIIVDVPTEEPTLQYLMTYHLPVAIGLPSDLAKGRLWVEGKHSLEGLLESLGLQVIISIKTASYLEKVWYAIDDATATDVLEQQVNERYKYIADNGKMGDAKLAWPAVWQRGVQDRPGGGQGIHEARPLYVCVGKRL